MRRELVFVNGYSGDDGFFGDDFLLGIEDIIDLVKVIFLIIWLVNKKLGSRNGMVIKCVI